MGSLSIVHWFILLLILGFLVVLVGKFVGRVAHSTKEPAPTTKARLQELETLKSSGQISEAEYARQRAAIIQSI
ncbi:MAG: SHOCT domain-containing protein [Rudaea sp.]